MLLAFNIVVSYDLKTSYQRDRLKTSLVDIRLTKVLVSILQVSEITLSFRGDDHYPAWIRRVKMC